MVASASRLQEIAPGENILLSLAYATPNNFTGKPVYKADARCFLHEEAALCLEKAANLAVVQGYKIKIFDAYRPAEVQWTLWNHTPDPDFLAPPWRGSPHGRGVAVDLTLCNSGGQELDMGTGFDAFTPLSHHGNMEISAESQRNRLILMGIMTTAGWDFYRNEWWHYQLFNSRSYPLLTDKDAETDMVPTEVSTLAARLQAEYIS